MPLITKPDFTYVWASGGAVVAPNDTKKQLGWIAEAPPFQYDNWLQNRQDQMLAHINQRGIPAWDGLTNYEAGGLSYVQGSDGKVYKSVAASGPSATVQNPTTDGTDTYWTIAFADVGAFLTQAAGDTRYTQRSSNLSDLTNVAAARTNLALGTAATATLTTSDTDTTAGRVMKVGDFGLGAVGTPVIANIDAFSTPSGFYKFTDGTGTKPVGGGAYAYVLINSWNGGTLTQTWIPYGAAQMFVRTATDSNTWGAWREIALTGSPAFTGTPTAPTAAAGTNTTQLATTAFVQASTPLNLKTSGIAGTFSNLKASATGTNATVTVTANSICLKNASNEQVVLNEVSVAPSLAASGANGIDTGTSAINTWYYLWVIWNGTTVAGLLSLSSTSPTMPSGYTHKARVGAVRSDSTANKYPLSFYQLGDLVQIDKQEGTNVAAMITPASGTTAGVMTTVSMSSFIPPTAKAARVTGYSGGDAVAQIAIAPSTQYSLYEYMGGSGSAGAGTYALAALTEVVLKTAASIAWQSNSANARLYLQGWRDNL